MDCQLRTSPLPGIWVIETLARSNQVDVSLLLDLMQKSPQISDNLGRNARELVSLRILESFLVQGAQSNSVSSSSSPKIALDLSESCEDVLQQILLETPASNLKAAGPEMWKWDVQSFVGHKRSNLSKHALQQLKDAILTGNHSFLASSKERSGLPFGNQAERGLLVDDDKCNGISNTCIGEGNDQLISPALANSSHLLHSDLPSENLLPVKRKRRTTTENAGRKSCKGQNISKIGSKNHTKFFKKYRNGIIHCEQDLGGNLISSGVNKQLIDTPMMIAQYSERERCSLERNTHVGGIGLNEPPEDDNNELTSLKDLGGPDEVLPCEKQAPHCDTELPNDKSVEEHGQENEIREAKVDKECFCDLNSTEDMDKFEPYIKMNVQNGEGEEHIHISSDSQCTYSRYSSATNCRDLNLLADICSRLVESSEVLGYSMGNRTSLGGMAQNGPPGDVDNEFISSKGLTVTGHDKVVHQEKQVCHHGTKVPNKIFDEEQGQDHDAENAGDKEGFHELKTTCGYKDRFEQEFHINVPDLDDAQDVDISSESDGYHDERTDIATKKNAFLSSQCTFSQGSVATIDWRELNVCVKCNKGGKLLVCSTSSCSLVIHESCLGSHATFGTMGAFYCPFCAYSQAISKCMDIKKQVSLTRKDLATFVCLGTRKELKKQSRRSYRMKQHHLEHDDGLHKSNELNNQDNAKRINNHQHRRKLEYRQAGYSTLRSGDNHPFGGKTVDSTNGTPHPLNKDKRGSENTGQMSHSPRVHGRHQMAAPVILKSQGENASCQVPEKSNGSESHSEIRPKKGVLRSPETHLPRQYKCSLHTESADAQERSEEENENSGVSKYFIRVQKHKRKYTYPEIPQLRRKRLPWTNAEEERLKEGMGRFCSLHDRYIPWKKILEFGAGVFQESRSTIDLKDKWRNLCKASPKS